MDSKPRTRVRGISAKTLSSFGYAVCFFPEQPRQQIVVEQDRAIEEVVQKRVVHKVEAFMNTTSTTEMIRLYWRNRLVYLIAFVSYSMSLNNMYHFPVNMYRYGFDFLLPYTVVTVVIGYPLHVLQASMGQYSQNGALWMWQCAPLCCGVGIAMIVACIFMSLYHNIFAAYSLVYFARCFAKVFPWVFCDDNSCNEDNVCAPSSWYVSQNSSDSSKDYFYNIVLNTQYRYPSEIWKLGSLKWWLCLSLVFSWFIVYVATLRSARSIGKVAIVIVVFSYFALVSLFIAVFQVKNEHYQEKAKETSVFNIQMWYSAVVQVLLELGLCYGIPITYGSYCRFRNLVHIDSLTLCFINYVNSIIFCILFLAVFRKSLCIDSSIRWDLPDDTMAVIYIIYSEITTIMPGKHYWCILFYFMLFCILIGTQIALTETIMTIIYDRFQHLSEHKWLFNLFICLFFCTFGTFFCFSNGFYGAVILYYIPTYVTSTILAIFFVVGIVVIYGLNQYFEDINLMLYRKPSFAVKLILYLLLICLVITFAILLFSVKDINLLSGITYYTRQAVFAWVLCAVILCPLVIGAIVWAVRSKKHRSKIFSSANLWKISQEQRTQGEKQYTTTYYPFYIWNWNFDENKNIHEIEKNEQVEDE